MRMKMLAMALILGSAAVARAEGPTDLTSMPALQSALKQMKAELALSDQQSKDAGKLIASRVRRVEVAIDSFGGVNFDSVLDLLVEARSIKDEFVPGRASRRRRPGRASGTLRAPAPSAEPLLRALAEYVAPGEAPELSIDQFHEPVDAGAISIAHRQQDLRGLGDRAHGPTRIPQRIT